MRSQEIALASCMSTQTGSVIPPRFLPTRRSTFPRWRHPQLQSVTLHLPSCHFLAGGRHLHIPLPHFPPSEPGAGQERPPCQRLRHLLSQVAGSCSDIKEFDQCDQVRLEREPSSVLGYVNPFLLHESPQELGKLTGHVKQQTGVIIGLSLMALREHNGRPGLRGDVNIEEQNVPITRGELTHGLGWHARITVSGFSIADIDDQRRVSLGKFGRPPPHARIRSGRYHSPMGAPHFHSFKPKSGTNCFNDLPPLLGISL